MLVVGAGFAGLLVARELVRAGRRVTVVERGGLKRHADQLRDGIDEVDTPTARHALLAGPEQPDYPWNVVHAVGGGSLRWAGVAPRLLPSDFALRSDHGVGRDWPVGYDELEPYYAEAERLLLVAGGESPLHPRSAPLPQPAHPFSPADRIVAEAMAPFGPLPQARLSEPVGERAACCANTNCGLCPVDAKTTMLHVLDGERLLEDPRLDLQPGLAVARLLVQGSAVTGVECLDAARDRVRFDARTVVLAAGGFGNPAILLASGLDGPAVGRFLNDHSHRLLHVELDRPFGAGRGAAHATGISWAHADGDWRDRRASQIVIPVNAGLLDRDLVRDGILDGSLRGGGLARLRERFERTLTLDILGEDLPSGDRRVELSPKRDRLGLPRVRVRYPDDSPYLEEARRALIADVERRLAPLGARVVAAERVAEGSHQLGTCFMGDDGVVDRDTRHHRLENLFVTGGSAFPTYSAHHPTLTICALALRLGRLLAGSAAP
ncbi:MAG TPA: GMC family oxidoreductase [Capillimicrobium sp.]